MAWSLDDLKLVSCADNGSLYEWNVATGERVHEVRYWERTLLMSLWCMKSDNGKWHGNDRIHVHVNNGFNNWPAMREYPR